MRSWSSATRAIRATEAPAVELGENGPVVAAWQILDRVVADPDALVGERVVDRDQRREAAVRGPGGSTLAEREPASA